jgi:hypothetical protein
LRELVRPLKGDHWNSQSNWQGNADKCLRILAKAARVGDKTGRGGLSQEETKKQKTSLKMTEKTAGYELINPYV